jgi:signal transduction histidine kinase
LLVAETAAPPADVTAARRAIETAAASPAPLHLEGVVTAVRPGDWLMLRTVTGSYEVDLTAESPFRPGDEVVVDGEPETHGAITRLVKAMIQRTGAHPPPEPIEMARPEEAAHGQFIAVRGRVRDLFQARNRARLILALEGRRATCTVFLEAPLDVASMELPALGSLVRVQGPVLRRTNFWYLGSDVTIVSAIGTKVETLAPPPYWNLPRVRTGLWLASVALASTLPVGGWLLVRTKRRARRQSELECSAAVAQERQRIAWEIHDSLHQEIAAARLHLDNLKTAAAFHPESVPALAEQTQAMLRHCQSEARNCIWDLRVGLPGDFGLATTLQRWLKVRQPVGSAGSLELRTDGETLGLNREQSFQIFRIAQETINNAMSHALAGTIVVTLRRTTHGVEMLVADDGCGFEASETVDREGIHFGLTMLRERAARIGAEIHFRSELGAGTQLRLLLPEAELQRE